MYQLILMPEGSSLPEDLQSMLGSGDDIIEKIMSGANGPKIVAVDTRELQMLVEYRDLFDLETTAIIGLQGAMYNTVWNTYVATMERTTVDALRAIVRETNDERAEAGTAAIIAPTTEARIARLSTPVGRRPLSKPEEASESDFGTDA